tara:strand:+ start:146 stop:943 length:798 start_codon:yes stop_codon:yes gene_type:complete
MTAEETLSQLKLHGWCVVENVIPPAEVDEVRQSVEASAAEFPVNKNNINIPDVLNVNQSFAPYLADTAILEPLRALWGPYIRMRTAKGFVAQPGYEGGGLHADGPYIQSAPVRMNAPYQDFIAKVTVVWMLSPFTEENGGTLLVPGSHRAPNNRTGGLEQPVPHPSQIQATGAAGSVVMFDARTWHGSGSNHSAANRVGLVMAYFPWWLGQDSSMPVGTPERQRLKEETGLRDDELGAGTPFMPAEVYNALPEDIRSLTRHWVRL